MRAALFGPRRAVEQQVGEAHDGRHRRADLVAHVGQGLALAARGRLGPLLGLGQGLHRAHQVGRGALDGRVRLLELERVQAQLLLRAALLVDVAHRARRARAPALLVRHRLAAEPEPAVLAVLAPQAQLEVEQRHPREVPFHLGHEGRAVLLVHQLLERCPGGLDLVRLEAEQLVEARRPPLLVVADLFPVPEAVVRALEREVEAQLALLARVLGLHALAQVAQERVEGPAAVDLDRVHGQLDQELQAGLVDGRHLDALAEDRPLAGLDEAPERLLVRRAQAAGDDVLGEALAEDRLALPAERALGLRVPADHAPLGVHRDQAVDRAVDHPPQVGLAALERLARVLDRIQRVVQAARQAPDLVGRAEHHAQVAAALAPAAQHALHAVQARGDQLAEVEVERGQEERGEAAHRQDDQQHALQARRAHAGRLEQHQHQSARAVRRGGACLLRDLQRLREAERLVRAAEGRSGGAEGGQLAELAPAGQLPQHLAAQPEPFGARGGDHLAPRVEDQGLAQLVLAAQADDEALQARRRWAQAGHGLDRGRDPRGLQAQALGVAPLEVGEEQQAADDAQQRAVAEQGAQHPRTERPRAGFGGPALRGTRGGAEGSGARHARTDRGVLRP